ncbi:hypothetical protein [Kitasatospora sp. NBC_01302]|uniref:hypothetical protein n=1 Tax=Kitasatospora sp. NBC_01302 TaxID=2903575 RepID=UPI002E11FEC3|nr:hypothetical protein OG294_13080 [Kitasatospora sp. NBC_01302]
MGSLRPIAVDGDAEAGRPGGPTEINTTRGDIRITEALCGEPVLRTESGDISVGAVLVRAEAGWTRPVVGGRTARGGQAGRVCAQA